MSGVAITVWWFNILNSRFSTVNFFFKAELREGTTGNEGFSSFEFQLATCNRQTNPLNLHLIWVCITFHSVNLGPKYRNTERKTNPL